MTDEEIICTFMDGPKPSANGLGEDTVEGIMLNWLEQLKRLEREATPDDCAECHGRGMHPYDKSYENGLIRRPCSTCGGESAKTLKKWALMDALSEAGPRLFAIARAAEVVALHSWGTSVSESHHFERMAAMDALRKALEDDK